jgi:hypothetical protein
MFRSSRFTDRPTNLVSRSRSVELLTGMSAPRATVCVAVLVIVTPAPLVFVAPAATVTVRQFDRAHRDRGLRRGHASGARYHPVERPWNRVGGDGRGRVVLLHVDDVDATVRPGRGGDVDRGRRVERRPQVDAVAGAAGGDRVMQAITVMVPVAEVPVTSAVVPGPHMTPVRTARLEDCGAIIPAIARR